MMKIFHCCNVEINDFGYGEIFNLPVNVTNILTVDKDTLTISDHVESLDRLRKFNIYIADTNVEFENILYRISFNMKNSEGVSWLFESEDIMMVEYNKLLKLEK